MILSTMMHQSLIGTMTALMIGLLHIPQAIACTRVVDLGADE